MNQKGTRAFLSRGQVDHERRFRAALRHSVFVRFLRVAVPAGVVGGFVLLVLINWLNPLGRLLDQLPGRVGNLVVSGTKITMEAPRLAGFTGDKRAYEMTARSAVTDITAPDDKMELQGVRAKFETQDHAMVDVTAASGLYDRKGDKLLLKEDVVIKSTSGYEGYLAEALVDLKDNNVTSDKPLVVKMLDGTLNANQMEVVKGGEIIRFGGGVKLILTKPPMGEASDQDTP
ncbi:MAG: LPS export ABC transporter periplasmic protein LptC [Xanthobacteraceae bacterium]